VISPIAPSAAADIQSGDGNGAAAAGDAICCIGTLLIAPPGVNTIVVTN